MGADGFLVVADAVMHGRAVGSAGAGTQATRGLPPYASASWQHGACIQGLNSEHPSQLQI
jgi:hypothetical protein